MGRQPILTVDILQSRWVDRYLLRYGPATILGAIITAYFYSVRRDYGVALDLPKDRYILSLVLIFGGFLYAYIASAPILIGHCARMFFHDPLASKPLRVTWGAMSVLALLLSWWHYYLRFSDPAAGFICGLAYTFLLSMWGCALIAYFQRKKVYEFYIKICAKRSDAQNAEIVESYRTLREHGNAFQIMYCEIILAAVVLVVAKTQGASSKEEVFWDALVLCVGWIGPAVMTWPIACRIEGDFARDSL